MKEKYEFYKALSDASLNLFQDPFSDLTKKRQTLLLISSVICILLSLAIFNPKDASIAWLKFTINKPEMIKHIAGIFCIYCLISYILNLYQDIKIYQYKKLPGLSAIMELSEKIALKASEKYQQIYSNVDKADEIIKDRFILIQESDTIRKKYDKQTEDLRKKFEQVKKELPDLRQRQDISPEQLIEHQNQLHKINEQQSKILHEIEKLRKLKNEELEPYRELTKNIDKYDGLQRILDDNSDKVFDGTEKEQLKMFNRVLKANKNINRIRICVEVVFPLLFSSYAIYLSWLDV